MPAHLKLFYNLFSCIAQLLKGFGNSSSNSLVKLFDETKKFMFTFKRLSNFGIFERHMLDFKILQQLSL